MAGIDLMAGLGEEEGALRIHRSGREERNGGVI